MQRVGSLAERTNRLAEKETRKALQKHTMRRQRILAGSRSAGQNPRRFGTAARGGGGSGDVLKLRRRRTSPGAAPASACPAAHPSRLPTDGKARLPRAWGCAGRGRRSRHSWPLAKTAGARPRGPAKGERVVDWGRGRADTVGLSRRCARPDPAALCRTGRRAAERRSGTLSVLVALALHAWAIRVAGRDRAVREPQTAIRPAPEK